MIIKFKYLFFLIIILFQACKKQPESKEKPVARVFEKYLYPSDIEDILSSGITGADSSAVVKDFIEKWVQNQLLLNKAEINLTDKEKDVEKQIENYRSSLLIYAYQQQYLQQKLDTVVQDKEIENYYKENQSNFILAETLMKGLYIKISADIPDLYKIRQWYRVDDPESIKNLEGYCFKNAVVYDHFNESWVNLNEVLRMMPENNSYEATLKYRKNLEIRDEDYYYFLNIKEIAPEGTVSPFEIVKNDIHNIILNKRKVKLINELESNIYSDAQNREYFTIY